MVVTTYGKTVGVVPQAMSVVWSRDLNWQDWYRRIGVLINNYLGSWIINYLALTNKTFLYPACLAIEDNATT